MGPAQVAVIGSGVAGMAAAWLLSRRYRVTVFEAAPRIGGHCNTVEVDDPRGPLGIDTGFIVFNPRNYPNLTALFDRLEVQTQPSDMSFAVSVGGGQLEYSGTDLDGLFGQRSNLVRPRFHRMLLDILRFNRVTKRLARGGGNSSEPLRAFLERERFDARFRDHYLLPMAAAIWSCPARAMLEFPALSLARFFDNHGLLDLANRPRWRTVRGGSRRYVERLTRDYADRIRTDTGIVEVAPVAGRVRVRDRHGEQALFDHVVVAAHADQALFMLAGAGLGHASVLEAFRYQTNTAVLHADATLMPRRRRVWSSWNYLADRAAASEKRVSVTYWMNRLQRLDAARDYFVSLNPIRVPALEHTFASFVYQHPVFDSASVEAQSRLEAVQGRAGIWLCGSYFGHGFHEDALRSALEVSTRLGCPPPWWQPAPRPSEGRVRHRSPATTVAAQTGR